MGTRKKAQMFFIDMVVPLCLLSFFRIFGIANRTTTWEVGDFFVYILHISILTI